MSQKPSAVGNDDFLGLTFGLKNACVYGCVVVVVVVVFLVDALCFTWEF